MKQTYRIGIDSGGTKIKATIYNSAGSALLTATSGPGNLLSDPTGTMKNMQDIMDQLDVFKNTSNSCQAILIGLAGMSAAAEQAKTLTELKLRFKSHFNCSNIGIVSDAQLGLMNGLANQDGFLVIAGTGSICYGRQNGIYLRSGGWGSYLGDEGGAYQIAQSAIRTGLIAFDHGMDSDILAAAFTFFKVDDVSKLVSIFYRSARTQIAKFALVVAHLADHGSQEAKQILWKQGDALGKSLTTLFNRYQKEGGIASYKIACSGSVLQHNAVVRQAMLGRLSNQYPEIQAHVVTRSNTAGVLYF